MEGFLNAIYKKFLCTWYKKKSNIKIDLIYC